MLYVLAVSLPDKVALIFRYANGERSSILRYIMVGCPARRRRDPYS